MIAKRTLENHFGAEQVIVIKLVHSETLYVKPADVITEPIMLIM